MQDFLGAGVGAAVFLEGVGVHCGQIAVEEPRVACVAGFRSGFDVFVVIDVSRSRLTPLLQVAHVGAA
ncbi:hypothetical protein D3C71_1958230 [compost metagenome]